MLLLQPVERTAFDDEMELKRERAAQRAKEQQERLEQVSNYKCGWGRVGGLLGSCEKEVGGAVAKGTSGL